MTLFWSLISEPVLLELDEVDQLLGPFGQVLLFWLFFLQILEALGFGSGGYNRPGLELVGAGLVGCLFGMNPFVLHVPERNLLLLPFLAVQALLVEHLSVLLDSLCHLSSLPSLILTISIHFSVVKGTSLFSS